MQMMRDVAQKDDEARRRVRGEVREQDGEMGARSPGHPRGRSWEGEELGGGVRVGREGLSGVVMVEQRGEERGGGEEFGVNVPDGLGPADQSRMERSGSSVGGGGGSKERSGGGAGCRSEGNFGTCVMHV